VANHRDARGQQEDLHSHHERGVAALKNHERGVAALTPAGFFAFIGAGLWVGAASILLAMRARSASQAPPA
jgi:hypothetical protein